MPYIRLRSESGDVEMSDSNFSTAIVLVMIVFRFESAEGAKLLKRQQNAVVPLVGSEHFYVQIKREIPVTYVDDGQLGHLRDYDYSNESDIDYTKYKNMDPPLDYRTPTERGQLVDLKAKSIICSLIIDSPFFKARGEVAVNYDLTQTEIMNELRKSKRDTYDDIYANYPDAQGQWLNPYKRRIVSVGGERFEEHTFRCVTRRRDPEIAAADSYVDYFVSPIYQLNKRPKDLMMNGRFVFTINDDKELILIATAEERLGKLQGSQYIKFVQRNYYLENQKGRKCEKLDETSNELCALPVRDKIRLCDGVINLPNFPDKVSFIPDKVNVKDKCEEIKVSAEIREYDYTLSFRKMTKRIATIVNITYDQWMVGCKVVGTGDDLPASSSWYYISVGIDPNSVLVFKESKTKNVYEGLTGVESAWLVKRGINVVPISCKVIGESEFRV